MTRRQKRTRRLPDAVIARLARRAHLLKLQGNSDAAIAQITDALDLRRSLGSADLRRFVSTTVGKTTPALEQLSNRCGFLCCWIKHRLHPATPDRHPNRHDQGVVAKEKEHIMSTSPAMLALVISHN